MAEHMRAHGLDVRLGASVDAVVRGEDGRIRAVRLAGRGRGRGRPRGLDDRRRAEHRLSGGQRGDAGAERGDRDGRRPAHPAPRRLGGRRLRERDLARRLAPAGAALVHGPRPGPRWRPARCWATRSPTAAAPGTTRPSSSTSSTRRPAGCRPRCGPDGNPVGAAPGPAELVPAGAGAVREPEDRGEGRPRRGLHHARLALEPRGAPRLDPRAAAPRLGAEAPRARRSSTRSSLRASASTPGRESPDAVGPDEHVPAPGEQPLVGGVGALSAPLPRLRPALLRVDPRAGSALRRAPERGRGRGRRPGPAGRPAQQVDPLRNRLHPGDDRRRGVRPAAPRQQPVPAGPDDQRRERAGRLRLPAPDRAPGLRAARSTTSATSGRSRSSTSTPR